MNILADENELLKYIEIRNKIESLFHKKFNKKVNQYLMNT